MIMSIEAACEILYTYLTSCVIARELDCLILNETTAYFADKKMVMTPLTTWGSFLR